MAERIGKTGLAFPFQSNGRGRLKLVSSEEQLRKIIGLNLSDLSSGNPFQEADLGLGSDAIFAIGDESLQAELRRRIQFLFRRLLLQNRAKLLGSPVFMMKSETQELEVVVKYLNLEENREDEVGITFSAGRAGSAASKQFIFSTSKLPGGE